MVFYLSMVLVFMFVVWGVVLPQNLANTATHLLDFTIAKFGWMYLITVFSFLIFCLYLAFSEFGNIKLGSDYDKPDYSNLTWFAMLFSAGMGIGLVFWGIAEPIYHYIDPPMGIPGQTPEAGATALRYSFFHWGLHPWSIYGIIALTLAYFQFRKKTAGLVSSTFFPLLGERVKGPLGQAIDILAIIATVFGVATSLGLGALQINGGLSHIFGVANNPTTQLMVILIVTVLYMLSANTGLNKGIKILSNLNITVAIGLLLFVLLLGPTTFIFDTFTTTLGSYLQNIIQMSLRLTPFTQGTWIGQWTLFYWAWWIAWAPFVGTFIARISKGRTIREFILGVLIAPSIFSFLWFAAFGGTALNMEMFQNIGIAAAVQADVTSALFITLEHLPLGMIISLLATTLIITFFITSADSATFVLGMLSTDGSLNPTTKVKIIWGILQSSTAMVLLLSGGLEGLQTMAILAALPFSIIMLLMCFSIYKALREEIKPKLRKTSNRQF